jgi:uncharacterized membrane protein
MDEVTLYEVLLFAHLTFASVWVGGNVMLQFFSLRANAAGPDRAIQFVTDVNWIGGRVITPAALLVAAFGVWLVADSPAWEFSQFWVTAALTVFLASFITGAGFLGPESGRIGRAATELGVDDPSVQRRVRRLMLISRIELLFLILVIFDMVVKPGL